MTERLASRGFRTIALKGAPLAQQVYGSLALRPYVDLDLLIAPADYPAVDEMLTADGFASPALSPLRKRVYVGIHRQYSYVRVTQIGPSQSLTPIDLHTGIMPPGYACDLPFDSLWQRGRTLGVMGKEVMTPGPEDLLLILCYHGFKNRWDRLKYVCDVGKIISVEHIDWTSLLRRAGNAGGRRVLLLGVMLADRLVRAPVPDDIRAATASEPNIARLADDIVARLPHQAHMRVEPYMDRLKLNLLGQDGPAGWARYSAYALFRRASELILPPSPDGP
jgi:hypothetical protein